MRSVFAALHPFHSIMAAIAVLGASLLARLHLASTLGLQKDELFYAVWARTPDGSYAWLPLVAIRGAVAIVGENALAVRLPFVLAMTGASVALFTLARQIAGSAAPVATWTLSIFATNVWAHLAGAQAHPDAFLAFFWIAALAALAPADREPRSRAMLCLGAALAAGAALSKYTGFLLWPAWTLVEWSRSGSRAGGRRDLLLASALWLALVSPGLAAVADDRGHWLRVALDLSDLRDRVPGVWRLLLLPASPLLYLASPAVLPFVAGPCVAWRAGVAGRRVLWLAAVVLLVFVAVAARGGLKGNWVLPALWGTLPLGVAWFRGRAYGTGWLTACAVGGIVATAAVHVAATHPAILDTPRARAGALAALDRSYAATVSAQERRHATSSSWAGRLDEWHLAAPLADSLARRIERGGHGTVVASDLYEVIYAVRFHQPSTPARIVGDARFRTMPEFAALGTLPRRFLYVTRPGFGPPEPLPLRYHFVEEEPELAIATGGGAPRKYELWRCGIDEGDW